jgi:hypothetical protein
VSLNKPEMVPLGETVVNSAAAYVSLSRGHLSLLRPP